jgi:parvulin-like peptidyl-prolyl isomerase
VIFLVAIGAVVFSVAWASRGAAASRTEAAAESLRKMGEQGVDQSPVATVNGVAIPRTTLEVHVATADLLGLGTATRRELLQDLVDSELLRQAAVEAGIQVSDDEVDAAIRAGLVDPLRGQLPLDLRQLLEAGLKAQGVTAESALDDARVRSAYAGLVLRGRYLQKLGKSASEVLPELRSRASIVIIDQDSIAPVRGKP